MGEAARTLNTETTTLTAALRDLEVAAADFLPLAALGPVGYAAKHALFESRSDQRERMTSWLVSCAAGLPRTAEPFRVLSIGCGDGTVDVEIARALALAGSVEYHGVEPHAPSAQLFEAQLATVADVVVSSDAVSFDAFASAGTYDLVIAVHSLYYVTNLDAALEAAHRLLAPGGRLVVLHAPRERLNSLVGVLAPGRIQEFSEAVARVIERAGWTVVVDRVDATLDLSRHGADGGREWRDILDFTVQAMIPDGLIEAVEHALRAAAKQGLALSHPVDAFVIS